MTTPTQPFDPAAWQLVPKVATEEMAKRFVSTYVDQSFALTWRAALSAAPTPPVDIAKMLKALTAIAEQKTFAELGEDEREFADFEGGFDSCVEAARVALKSVEDQP